MDRNATPDDNQQEDVDSFYELEIVPNPSEISEARLRHPSNQSKN